MTALTKFFFRAPYSLPKTGEILRWWESRRLGFNLAVGAAGLFSLTVVAVAEFLPPSSRLPTFPLGLVVIYGILANICYTMGPLADLVICKQVGPRLRRAGPGDFPVWFRFRRRAHSPAGADGGGVVPRKAGIFRRLLASEAKWQSGQVTPPASSPLLHAAARHLRRRPILRSVREPPRPS